MFLIPATAHRVTWTKQNLLDSAEYFPRAVIRDQLSNTVLATLDLENAGDDIRYSRLWDVVQDPTGQGREIEVEITVYEDSGHTTPSGTYGRWTETFTILDITSRMGRGGGMDLGGDILDYDRVRSIFGEELAKNLPAIIEKLKPEMPDLTELVQSVDGVKETIWERLRKVLTLAKKAESAEEAAEHIREGVAALKEALTGISKGMQGAREEMRTLVSGAKREISAAEKDAATRAVEVVEDAATRAVEVVEDAATRAVEVFKKNAEASAEKMAKKLNEGIEEILTRPLKIRASQDYDLVREERTKEGSREDARVSRFTT